MCLPAATPVRKLVPEGHLDAGPVDIVPCKIIQQVFLFYLMVRCIALHIMLNQAIAALVHSLQAKHARSTST